MRDVLREAAEVVRRHTGVAAVLIHLIAGRLDEERRAARLRLLHRRFDHERVRRAQRIHAHRGTPLVPADDVEQRLHAESSGCSASINAASSASAMPAMRIGPGITPTSTSEMIAVSRGAPALTSGETMIALP